MSFSNVLVRVTLSKSAGKKTVCRFRVNGRRSIRHIFHCFQNVLASCERSVSFERKASGVALKFSAFVKRQMALSLR